MLHWCKTKENDCIMILLLLCFIHSQIYIDIPAVESTLKQFQESFVKDAGAKQVASELQRLQVIPEPVETNIERAEDRKTANGLLYDHLYAQGTFQTLEIVCDVFIEEEGYPRMNQLGRKMKEELIYRRLHYCHSCKLLADWCPYFSTVHKVYIHRYIPAVNFNYSTCTHTEYT